MSTDVSQHYDRRGERALSQKALNEAHPALSAPYDFLKTKIAENPQNKILLDLCCGTGVHSRWAVQLGYRVIGVDVSEKSIEAAKRLTSNAEFYKVDAVKFLRESQPFDVIMMSGSLYYFKVDEMVPLIASRLKLGGMFICVETYGDNPFLNFYRWLRYSHSDQRDEASLNQLLGSWQIERARRAFELSEVRYFDFLTLGLRLMPVLNRLKPLIFLAKTLDYFLLNVLKLKIFSFKFVFVGLKKKSNENMGS